MKHLLISLLLLMTGALSAAVIEVGAGRACPTIRTALERAHSGDTILVHPGVYAEGNLEINKPLSLIGIGYPVLDGRHLDEVITVNSPYVTVQGFDIRNSGQMSTKDLAGIKVLSADSVVIAENRFQDCNFAIYLSNTIGCRVSRNVVRGIIKEIGRASCRERV